MRTVLILTAGIAIGYALNDNKYETVDYLVRVIAEKSKNSGTKLRKSFSTSVQT